MNMDTKISADMDAADINARYDHACKTLLAEKYILAWIMRDCLDEYRDISIEDIVTKYIEGTPQIGEVPVMPNETNAAIRGIGTEDTSINEGCISYDIRFMATVPSTGKPIQLIINVEAQNDFSPGYPLVKRALYYCARMISAQYGTEFGKMDYAKIKKVYSIWICIDPPKKRRGTVTAYKMRECDLVGKAEEPLANYDLLTVVMVCLGGKRRRAVLRLLNTLLSKTTKVATKKKVLERDFNIPMNTKFEEEATFMCNLSEGVYKRGYDKGKAQAVWTLMKTANVTKEKAMDLLEIPPEKREAYGKLVQKMGQGKSVL